MAGGSCYLLILVYSPTHNLSSHLKECQARRREAIENPGRPRTVASKQGPSSDDLKAIIVILLPPKQKIHSAPDLIDKVQFLQSSSGQELICVPWGSPRMRHSSPATHLLLSTTRQPGEAEDECHLFTEAKTWRCDDPIKHL